MFNLFCFRFEFANSEDNVVVTDRQKNEGNEKKLGAQHGSNVHQKLSQAVQAAAVAAVGPVAIAARVLDEEFVPGGEQDLAAVRVLVELGHQRLQHHRIPDR